MSGPKLTLVVDDETRPIWETAKRARAEVSTWPPSKGGPGARIVSMNNGRTWHSVLRDKEVTIVTHCGAEMTRGSWLQTEDQMIGPNCKRCERARAKRPHASR